MDDDLELAVSVDNYIERAQTRRDSRKIGKKLEDLLKDLRERESRNENSGHPSLQGFAAGAGYAAEKIAEILKSA